MEAGDDLYAKAALRAVLDGLDEGYAALAGLEVWPDWPSLSFRNQDRQLWNPDGNEPRYAEFVGAIKASWGLKPEGL